MTSRFTPRRRAAYRRRLPKRVEEVLGRRVPEDLQMALIDQAVEPNADARRLQPQAQRHLVKAEEEPGPLGGGSREKMQSEAGLS